MGDCIFQYIAIELWDPIHCQLWHHSCTPDWRATGQEMLSHSYQLFWDILYGYFMPTHVLMFTNYWATTGKLCKCSTLSSMFPKCSAMNVKSLWRIIIFWEIYEGKTFSTSLPDQIEAAMFWLQKLASIMKSFHSRNLFQTPTLSFQIKWDI